MNDFRSIGDLAVGLMQRISSGDLPLWEELDDGADHFGQQPGVFERHDFPHMGGVGIEATDGEPPASWRAGGRARGRNFTVIDGGVARTHAARTTRRRPAAPLSIAAIDGESVHGYAFSGTR